MGAVASGFEKANNAAMFSTTDTINQGFQQMDIAAMGEAHGRQQAQQQANISAQYGVGPGPMGQMGPYQPWMGYTNFNQFLFAIGYLLLGVFAIAFGVTYFVEMTTDLAFTLSSLFLFFLFHHFIYMVVRLNAGGYISTSAGFGIVITSAMLGVGMGAMWTFYLLDKIRGKEIADYTIGISMGVLLLFLLVSWSYRRVNYAWRSTAYAQGPYGGGPRMMPM